MIFKSNIIKILAINLKNISIKCFIKNNQIFIKNLPNEKLLFYNIKIILKKKIYKKWLVIAYNLNFMDTIKENPKNT